MPKKKKICLPKGLDLDTIIKAEWASLKEVMIHKPQFETFFGLLEPETFLYERHFSIKKARKEHDYLETMLKDAGVRVHILKDVITRKAEESAFFKGRLIDIATHNIRFIGKPEDKKEAQKRFQKAAEEGILDVDHLFNLILLRPSVNLSQERPIVKCDEPLANVIFMRDQQAVGDRGVIFGSMHAHQRRRETILTKLALEALECRVGCCVTLPGVFEGGDFLPLKDFALIGVGPRSNLKGVTQILEKGGVSFDEVGIVNSPTHPLLPEPDPQVCMHLDTYLNAAADGVLVGHRPLLETATIDIYERLSKKPLQYGKQKTAKLLEYLDEKDFHIIDINTLEQVCYASNFLCLEDGYILSVDVEEIAPLRLYSLLDKVRERREKYEGLYRQALKDYEDGRKTGEFFPHKKELRDYGIESTHISVTNITGGYGGIHCLTCALSRT
jgi:arginine deiminase